MSDAGMKMTAISGKTFSVYEKDGHIDLGCTLAEMPNDILIKMAADIGIETPGLLPCIPVMKNILGKANASAYANFERAVRDVYDCPDQSVALAASTLEGVFKAIIQDMDPNASVGNLSLSKLTSKVVKELVDACDPSTPQEVKTLAAQLRSLGSSIDNLRSDKSTAHGKAPGESGPKRSSTCRRHSEYSYGGSTNGTPGGERNRQGRFRCTAGTSRSDGWPRTCASSGPMLRCC